MKFLGTLIFLVDTILICLVVFLKLSIFLQQQIFSGVLVITLLFVLQYTKPEVSQKVANIKKYLLVFLSSFLIQILIASTGLLYSPFLILFHIYILLLSLIFDFYTAISFLVFAIFSLIIEVNFNSVAYGLFINDPWVGVVYAASLVAILPIYYLLFRRYKMKEAVSALLFRHIKLSELQDKYLLESLSDLVFVTDKDFHILSFDEAVETTLKVSYSEIINQDLFQTLFLKDDTGKIFKEDSIEKDNIIKEKITKLFPNLFLYTRNSLSQNRVSLQVRPIVGLEGNVDKIIFVVSSNQFNSKGSVRSDLNKVSLNNQATLNKIKKGLKELNLKSLRLDAEMLGRAERDLFIAQELSDHTLEQAKFIIDIADLTQSVVTLEQDFAGCFNVKVDVVLDPKYYQDAKNLIPPGSGFPVNSLTSKYYSVYSDWKYLDLLLQELVDLSILISSKTKDPKVKLVLSYNENTVFISVITSFKFQDSQNSDFLFSKYYIGLPNNLNLDLGSGLEGYLAKTISLLLNIQITITSEKDSGYLTFNLRHPKS